MSPSLFTYIVWHYKYGLPNLFLLTIEFLRFIFGLFSIRLFLGTLFSPMFSVKTSLKDAEDATEFIPIIASNLVLRTIGFFLRTLLIICGMLCAIVTLVFMLALIALWALLPLLFLFCVYAFIATLMRHI